ncbi:MAG TPA: cytochrome P450 [Solirubrobacteraceae bacterium]|nr:cytochrome P450 [Solirubrobacteraceae bacterium]
MQVTAHSSTLRRLKRELPPSPPQPAALQTLGAVRWPFRYLKYCQNTCGDPFTLYPLDMAPMVFFADPAEVRSVLTGDAAGLHAGAGAKSIAPLIGSRAFVLLEEDEHAWGRKVVAPAFHKRMVEEQTAALTDVVEAAVQSWPLGTPIRLLVHVRALALTVILRVIFGEDPEMVRLHTLLGRMLGITDTLLLQGPRLQHVVGWRGTWRRFVRERREVSELLRRLVTRREHACEPGEHADLLGMLLSAASPDGSPLSWQQIRHQLMLMIIAGHETTAAQLAWAFLMLAHNQAVQDRLADELDCGGAEYLTATVHETLRHKPVFVFAIPREVVSPVEIGAWTYRPPVQLVPCTYLLHHNPDLYPDPDTFRPERFLGVAPQSRTWLPWGGGLRHCLGRHFAMLEVTTILRQVISTRTVLPVSERVEQPRWRSAILVPAGGARVVLESRDARRRIFFGCG